MKQNKPNIGEKIGASRLPSGSAVTGRIATTMENMASNAKTKVEAEAISEK
ncbi:hypothetical protein C1H46_017472 [Malus baccata]|uniref:Uncharacterized protein n=1 Tax=Malus baccata TaxID=106549 RepID=A0A540MDV1_MALBA|nr:hypothetical protein C1H46_017472 [Malus baccata]